MPLSGLSWLAVLAAWLCLLAGAGSLKIAAFNVQVFGKSKANKPDVMKTIAKIISRYDIILLMEIRDVTGEATRMLKDTMHRLKDEDTIYGFEISDRLGRTKSKEEYIFIYRKDRGVSVLDSYHYDDGDEETRTDTFEREPFIVRFRSTQAVVRDFSLVAIHTNPKKALSEINSLMDVYDDVKLKWGSDDIIVLGDLNADCNYVRKSHWKTVLMRNDPKFYWPIGDGVDTTVTDTDCAYDRFIVVGSNLKNNIVKNSANIFDFPKAFKLSKEKALAVSDHYPIELTLNDVQGPVGGGGITSASVSMVIGSTVLSVFQEVLETFML